MYVFSCLPELYKFLDNRNVQSDFIIIVVVYVIIYFSFNVVILELCCKTDIVADLNTNMTIKQILSVSR